MRRRVELASEVSCEFIVMCGDCPETFEFVEEALDEVALGVEREVAKGVRFCDWP